MKFTTIINNSRCIEWGITPAQGALMDLFNQLSSWATAHNFDGDTYYHVARSKIVEELPLFFNTNDTVYRNVKDLHEKGLVDYFKRGKLEMIRLTEEGMRWNSDRNPSLGSKSEKQAKNSDSNPTYNNTIYKETKSKLLKAIGIHDKRQKYWDKYSQFYKNELVVANMPGNDGGYAHRYETFLMVLHGSNDLEKPLTSLLSLEPVTFSQFIKLEEKRSTTPFSYTETLLKMYNWKGIKNKKTIYQTFLTFIK